MNRHMNLKMNLSSLPVATF